MAWPEADDLMLGLVVRARTEKEGPGNGVPPWFEGALLALEAVGALSAAEAAEWRARVERDAADRDVGDHDLASDTTRRRAGEMLEALLVPARSRRTREANEEPFETLLAAREVARVFSPPEIEGWLERLSDARGVRGPAQAREELPSAAKLLAVVPGSQPGEGELHVRWVELYSDAVVVHWLETVDLGSVPPARGEERLMRDARGFELADDRGGSFASDGTEAELRRLGTRRERILTEAAAHDWSARAEQAWATPRRRKLRRDPELRGRVKKLLERLLGKVTPLAEREPSEGWSVMMLGQDEFGGALEAIDALRLLDSRQYERWADRWFRALDEGREESALARGPTPEETYAAVDLLAVIAPSRLGVNAPVRVTCAELYADCVSIAWQMVVPQDEWAPGEELGDVTLRRANRTLPADADEPAGRPPPPFPRDVRDGQHACRARCPAPPRP